MIDEKRIKKFIIIPEKIIYAADMDIKRVMIFIYFYLKAGLDNSITFSVDSVVKWSGGIPNRHKGKINDKYLDIISQLKGFGYLRYTDELTSSNYIEAFIDKQLIMNERPYAIIYLDEVNKILSSDVQLGTAIVLLMFSFLRMNIPFRGKQGMESYTFAEAYNNYFKSIAAELGISSRSVSKATDILIDLDLIYARTLPRYQSKSDKRWHSDQTIFCNTYRYQDKDCMLVSDSSYYRNEYAQKYDELKKTEIIDDD